jgi:ABC-type transport system substrate-binding protein
MAIREYKTVIEADPSDRDANFFRAYSYHQIGSHWPAISDYDKVLELSPSAVAYNNRGDVYKDMGRYEQAIEDYTEAIKLDPDYAQAYNSRAMSEKSLGKDGDWSESQACSLDSKYCSTPTPAPTPTPTPAPTPKPHGMQLSVNGTALNPSQTVFDISNGQLVFNPAPDASGKYDQDTSITVTAYPTVAGSTVILGGVSTLSGNTGTILARGSEWSMTASITLPLATPIPTPTATTVPIQLTIPTPVPTATAVPTPTPTGSTATPTPVATTESYGSIYVGQKETGIFEGHPSLSSSPRIQFVSSSVGEGLITIGADMSANPMLAESWSVSPDFTTWTWKFQKGVQFHKGYGEMTAEDVLYSYQQWYSGALHARSGIIGEYFNNGSRVVDDYTLEVDTGAPWMPSTVFDFMKNGGGSSSWVVSKKQSQEIGVSAASKDIAATGPWQIKSHSSGEYWQMSAVQNHWRQTPYFDELVYWTIPEESARVAGFQTGQLDSFDMAFDSITTVKSVEGAQVVGWPNAGQAGLNFYGQTYGLDKDGNDYSYYDCTNAWVSCDLDTGSEEWARGVKVRKALNIAIDRQTIVDEILSGFGAPQSIRDWMGHDARANPGWVYPYDPELAKAMLAEAGYPDGFEITVIPSIRGAPGEVEACEAVGQYWEDIGVDVTYLSLPYATIRPYLITRQYQGVTCHTVSIRLTPIIGASNYLTSSTFSYGTHHPWLEEHVTATQLLTNPVEIQAGELEIYNWMFDNAIMASIYKHDGIWPIGYLLEPGWLPTDYSELRTASAFEYAKHR